MARIVKSRKTGNPLRIVHMGRRVYGLGSVRRDPSGSLAKERWAGMEAAALAAWDTDKTAAKESRAEKVRSRVARARAANTGLHIHRTRLWVGRITIAGKASSHYLGSILTDPDGTLALKRWASIKAAALQARDSARQSRDSEKKRLDDEARKTKASPGFPLYIRCGRWCKSVQHRGTQKLYYFGSIRKDPTGERAVARWRVIEADLRSNGYFVYHSRGRAVCEVPQCGETKCVTTLVTPHDGTARTLRLCKRHLAAWEDNPARLRVELLYGALQKWARVRFLNGDTTDFRPENLKITNRYISTCLECDTSIVRSREYYYTRRRLNKGLRKGRNHRLPARCPKCLQSRKEIFAMSWKQALLEARKMMGSAGVAAYDRAQLLCRVFADKDFKADSGDDGRASDRLSEYTNDLALSFLELRQLLAHYPRRVDWETGKLRTMYDKMAERVRADTATIRKQVRADAPAESQSLAGAVQRPDANQEICDKRCNDLIAQNTKLRMENAALKRENDRLRHRIQALQKILNEEPAESVA